MPQNGGTCLGNRAEFAWTFVVVWPISGQYCIGYFGIYMGYRNEILARNGSMGNGTHIVGEFLP